MNRDCQSISDLIAGSTTQKPTSSNGNTTMDDSMGILSLKSDISSNFFDQVRADAMKSLNRSPHVSMTPSLIKTQSTISESDFSPQILKGRSDHSSSTPFSSTGRYSNILNQWRDSLLDGTTSINSVDQLVAQFDSFKAGNDTIEARLNADEESWKREMALPTNTCEFTVDPVPQDSIGSFFIKKSDNLAELLGQSPRNTMAQTPIPLISVSQLDDTSKCDAVIEKLLSDDEKTPRTIVNCLLESKDLTPQKENISPEMNLNKTVYSSRSTSTLSNLPDGKLPIESSKGELVWDCIKLGKSSTQEFVLRNRSASRLRIHCTTGTPSFKLIKERENESFNTLKIILHPYETRSISVIFTPVVQGAQADEINFTAADLAQNKKQCIRLYGYGGNAQCEINGIAKDTAGRHWLSLNPFGPNYRGYFTLINNGTLPAFAYIKFISKDVTGTTKLTITPERLSLLPGEVKEISIEWRPKRNEVGWKKSLLELGALQVIAGAEATRGRLRRLCRKTQETGGRLPPLCETLKETYEGEMIPNDLVKLKETTGALKQLLRQLHIEEVVVVVKQDPDETLVGDSDEESVFYQTLCQENSMTVMEGVCSEFKLEPSTVLLLWPAKIEDFLIVKSNCKRRVKYECRSMPNGLEFDKNDGWLEANGMAVIRLQYVQKGGAEFKVRVVVNGEVLEASVKIVAG